MANITFNKGVYTIAGSALNTLTITGTVGGTTGNGAIISAPIVGGGFVVDIGSLTLSGANTFTGTLTDIKGIITGTEGAGLATTFNINLSGSTGQTALIQTSGTFVRALGTGADQIQLTGSATGVDGFSQSSGGIASPLIINLGGVGITTIGANLVWGSALFNPGTFQMINTGPNGGATLLNTIDLNGNTSHNIKMGGNGAAMMVLAGGIINSAVGCTRGRHFFLGKRKYGAWQ